MAQQESQKQVNFSGGLNGIVAPHLLSDSEVAASTNIDFSLEWGGAPVRRGSTVYAWEGGHGGNPVNIQLVARNYGLSTGAWTDSAIPWYALADNGDTFQGTGSAIVALATITGRAGGAGAQGRVYPQAVQYQDYMYMANGSSAFKTNGTSTYDWLIPKADTPTVTFAQQGTFTGSGAQAGAFPGFTGTLTAVEGTVTASSTSTYFGTGVPTILTTCTTGTGSRIILQGAASYNDWENAVVFITLPTGTGVTLGSGTYTLGGAVDFHQGYPGGETTGTYTGTATITNTMNIGKYGVDYMLLGLPDQQTVVTIHRDLSYGDSSFTNYWHVETTPEDIQDAFTDPLTLLLEAQGNQSYDDETSALNYSRVIAPNVGRRLGPTIPNTRRTIGKTAIAGTAVSPWAVARGDYKFIGMVPNPSFSNIQAMRVIIEFSDPGKRVVVGGCVTYGAEGWCLNDQASGIQYYQTYARVENGVVIAEGAASDPSPATPVQYAYGQIVCTSATNTTAGITHRVFYRSGGLLQDAHRVGSATITSGTATIYDYAMPDMLIVSRPTIQRDLWSVWPSTSAGTGLQGVNAVSEPWLNRLWIGAVNQLYWSLPGNPSQIQDNSQTTVADSGDPIAAIIPYNNLVIVNRASVYELAGSIFEGTNQNWTLQRTGARRGCAAPKTCIKTPQGILLFSYDGMSLYRSGFGADTELDWVYERIGDIWKGTGVADPAPGKGRLPAINQSAIFTSCAAYKDEKIYLAVPTGTNTQPDSVYVLDLAHERVWLHTYPFKVLTLFWDKVSNRMMAGTDKGTIHQLETGLTDATTTGTAGGTSWSFTTKSWSTPTDLLLENLQIEGRGTWTGFGVVDNTNTYTLTTSTNATKVWTPASLQAGTIGDSVLFSFTGTQSGTAQELYQLQWDFIPLASKVTYYRSADYVLAEQGGATEAWWHQSTVGLDLIGTATVTATFFIDQVAQMTQVITSTRVGHQEWPFAYPTETYGKVAHVVVTATTPFKPYSVGYDATPEPSPVLFYETPLTALPDECYVKTWMPDVNQYAAVLGTITGVLYLDGVATSTETLSYTTSASGLTSMRRRVFELGLSNITVAKNVKATYTSATPFKHYRTRYEFEHKPFNKKTWLITYRKAGGFTQLDLARFYSMDLEGTLTATITSRWLLDGTAFTSNTFTLTTSTVGEVSGVARSYIDQVPFPPGGRAYLFQQEMSATVPFRVWRSTMDIERIGVKGLSRTTVNGTPSDTNPLQEQE